jgi:hypothetical protein
MADHWRRRPSAPVQVASVPTLHRRSGLPPADVSSMSLPCPLR